MSTAQTSGPERAQAREASPLTLPEHDALIQEIAADARLDPERYLDESAVPEGGE